MSKIYIPTSSLNFNNIISTESISPMSFYKNRKFGYKRFYNVKPNPFQSILLGYNKIPEFTINDTDLDDYPLIIEISEDMLEPNSYTKVKCNEIEIYKITNTIYFNPKKTRFYFFSEKEKKICLLKVAPSIETKLIPLYQRNVKTISLDNVFTFNNTILKSLSEITTNKITNDLYINRLKGFNYCYHLGIIYTKIKNKKNLEEYHIKKMEELIKYIDDYGFNYIESNKIYQHLIDTNERYKNFDAIFIMDLNNNKITNFKDSILDKDNNEIYRNIINDLIAYPIYDTQSFLDEKVELALKMGGNFKELYNQKWDGSKEQTYINSLLDNLESYTPFNLKDTDNEILKSISLLILKGDDIEKLFNALKQNKIKDYRIAFGLWGALFGFSAIPKTLSNILFEEKTKDIIDTQSMLKEMYKKIHNFNIQEDIEIDFIKEKVIEKNEYNKKVHQQNSKEVLECPNCNTKMIKKSVKQGKFQGHEFFGCKNYPECIGKRDLNGNALDNNFKLINQSSLEKYIIQPVRNLLNTSLTQEEIRDEIYQYLKNNGEVRLESKRLKISNIMEYLNSQQIKVPNTKRKFSNKEVKFLIQNNMKFEIIGKSPEYLHIKEN